MTSCASSGGASKVAVSPERQKAVQDSLNKIWERKLLIAWSTAYEHHKNKLYSEAIPNFWKVFKMDTVKKFPDLYTFLGDCYVKLNNPDSAEVVYRLGTERFPEKSHYHRSLAWLLSAKGENSEAIEQYQATIELAQDNASDFKELANLLVKEDRIEEAIDAYNKYLELNPNDLEVKEIVGTLFRTTGNEDAYIESLIETVKNDPENTKAMFTLGEIYFKRANYNQAIEYLNKYLAIKPDDVIALEYVGNAQQNLGQFNKAIATYDKILAVDAGHKKVLCEMATCYRELGQLSKARSTANKALKIDSGYGLAYIVRGEVYEDAVDGCLSKRDKRIVKFDDKLIYKMAYDEYAKALKSFETADIAKKRMSYIQPDIPTTEDYFMHPDQKKARLDCYKWIY